MRGNQEYLAGLAQLASLASDDERRAVWRQGLAALAAAAKQQPTPLEGLSPEGLQAGARVALAAGLVDDLDWLSKPVAASALFELAAALPQGAEKRELGRRVFTALQEGDAATFASLARSLALGSRRALAGGAVRARVALCLRLPIGTGTGVDALALALISRPELEREWLSRPTTESLPSRRLAAQLVERAAREVARRAKEGDDGGVRVFERLSVRTAWARLLGDSESLVWRHVATARGLLLATLPAFADEIDRGLSPRQGPAEWRRAACSLAASIAHDPGAALERCRELALGDLPRRAASVKVAMVHGLSRAGEEEPEAAEELLRILVKRGETDVVEALVELRQEHAGSDFASSTAALVAARLRAASPSPDDGLVALRLAIAEDLSPGAGPAGPGGAPSLIRHLDAALLAFTEGRALRPVTEAALATARALVDDLEGTADGTPEQRGRAFRALRQLDRGLLETSTLGDLLTVCGMEGGGGAVAGGGSGPIAASGGFGGGGAGLLGGLLARLRTWICKHEAAPLVAAGEVPHLTLRLRRLRTLLHVLDVEGGATDDGAVETRERRLRTLRLLLDRVEGDPPSALRRTTCAALARACDALVRDEICELSDVLVAVSAKVARAEDLAALAEASMVPDLRELLRAAAEVARLAAAPDGAADRSLLQAFQSLAGALPPGISPRVEGLRRALVGIARALPRIHSAGSLAGLQAGTEGSALEPLEEALQYGARLCAGVRRRVGLPAAPAAPTVGAAIKALDVAIDHALRDLGDDLGEVVAAAVAAVRADLPAGIAGAVARILGPLAALPAETPFDSVADAATQIQAEPRLRLPDWLPPSRILGGFHVVRPIGSGAVGSVFVARRAEERHDDNAETYALKVPSYDGQNAHTLTEQQFLQLFREEAGALLTLPQHPNLAGFVTFDARVRPKPILVMELVHGPTLERMLDKRELSAAIAFAVLDGIAAGLGAMHAAGVGHLDVKPGNIILRLPPGGSVSRLVTLDSARPTAVLVDFGLSGRKVRPGCASPYCGAPEVWDTSLRLGTDPTAADVYAFCCLAYELLVGRPLFHAETLPALIACHFNHDGTPPALARLQSDPRLAPLVEVLAAGLAPRAEERASIADMRAAIAGMAPGFEHVAWPLAA